MFKYDEDGEFLHLTYCYCYRDEEGNSQKIYSYKLLPDDPAPKGRAETPCLRELECRLKMPKQQNPLIEVYQKAIQTLLKVLRFVKICDDEEYKNNVVSINGLMCDYQKIVREIAASDKDLARWLCENTKEERKIIRRYTKG